MLNYSQPFALSSAVRWDDNLTILRDALHMRRRDLLIPTLVYGYNHEGKTVAKLKSNPPCFGWMNVSRYGQPITTVTNILIGIQYEYNMRGTVDELAERIKVINAMIRWLTSKRGPYRNILYLENGNPIFHLPEGIYQHSDGWREQALKLSGETAIFEVLEIMETRISPRSLINFLIAIRNTWQFFDFAKSWYDLYINRKFDPYHAWFLAASAMIKNGRILHLSGWSGDFFADSSMNHSLNAFSLPKMKAGDIPAGSENEIDWAAKNMAYTPCNAIWSETGSKLRTARPFTVEHVFGKEGVSFGDGGVRVDDVEDNLREYCNFKENEHNVPA